ncbi:MAG: CDP-alcohol phosphatidyltransferase family protein [Alphaproteobacteria bacterium]|nr:MAG: CDP-alcohol phosphatidyltransferase family protein [Alphaproteobacteria bacterium]
MPAWTPNALGILRLLAAPLIVWLVLRQDYALATWVYLFAGVTDGIDGFIARRFGLVSELGKLLDPVADKTVVNFTFIATWWMGLLPWWFVVLVLARDTVILGAFLVTRLSNRFHDFSPHWLSKANTGLQIALGTLVLANSAYALGVAPLIAGFTWAIAATTVITLGVYIRAWTGSPTASA